MSSYSRALLTLSAVLLAFCAVSSRTDATAASPENYGAIARTALAAVGQYSGQCFPWARSIVLAATGRTIGFDYRAGYLQAGAVEVSVEDARDGDVIQIANDANTAAWADYAGLHTAIVLDNEGGGAFRVVDANSQFDGVVRIRDRYSPAAEAARYAGLTFHAYRFPGAAAPAIVNPPPSTSPAPAGLAPGVTATVSANGDCLRLRGAAGASGGVLTCLPSGFVVAVKALGPAADGYHWVRVSAGGLDGWLAAEYLTASAAPAPPAAAAAPAPPPAANPPATASAPPLPAPSYTTNPPAAASAPATPTTYTAVDGDTLSGIAVRFQPPGMGLGEFIDELNAANGLAADSILSIGQVITIHS